MAILFYIRTRLRRSVLQSMSILLLFAALLAFFGFFEGFLSKKEQELDAAWNTVPVIVTVSNLTGTKTEDLDIHGYLVNYFLSDRYLFEGREQPRAFSSYFQNVQVTGKVYYSFGGVWSDMQKLVGMTEAATERTFSPLEKGRISFYSGYDSGIFSCTDACCVIPKALLERLTPENGGRYFLSLQFRMTPTDRPEEPTGCRRLEVVGTCPTEDDTIYCSWSLLAALQEELNGKVTASSLSAMVRDNRELDQVRALLLRHFAEVDPSGQLTEVPGNSALFYFPFAVTVHDEALRGTLNTLNRNLQTLYALRPVFVLVECLILLAAAFFFVFSRRRELAAARSLGTRRTQVLAIVLSEMTLLLLLGLGVGLLTVRIVPLQAVLRWSVAGLLFLAAELGAALAGLASSGRTGVRILREEE